MTFSAFLGAPGPDDQARVTGALVAGTRALLRQGYNAVQLPLALGDLLQPPARPAAHAQPASAAAACWQAPLGEVRLNATTGAVASAAGAPRPGCVSPLPNTTALDRVLWSVQWFVAHGLYVTLSAASSATGASESPSCGAGAFPSCAAAAGALPAASAGGNATAAFAAAWVGVWRALTALPKFESDLAARVFLQLLHDPAAAGARWEGGAGDGGRATPGLGALYLAAMDAVEAVRPGGTALFVLPGAAQRSAQSASAGGAWGHGFATEPAMLAAGMSGASEVCAHRRQAPT